jgi:hypothetical protein
MKPDRLIMVVWALVFVMSCLVLLTRTQPARSVGDRIHQFGPPAGALCALLSYLSPNDTVRLSLVGAGLVMYLASVAAAIVREVRRRRF